MNRKAAEYILLGTATAAFVTLITLLIVALLRGNKAAADAEDAPGQACSSVTPASGYDLTKRGYRNNNPGNIRISSNAWKGKVQPNTDGTFEQFCSMPYGFRALIKNLQTYITAYGCNTLEKMISKWAPSGENHTSLYLQTVAGWTGIRPDAVIGKEDKINLTKIVTAIARYENGSAPQAADIAQAWKLI